MTANQANNFRNVAVVGHEGSGETTMVEAFLHEAGLIQRMGRVEDHNTVSDFNPDEKESEKSYFCTTLSFPYEGKHFNMLEVPGSPDCIAEAITALHAVECALVCVDAVSGIKVNTRKMWELASKLGVPRIITVNRLDAEHTNFWTSLENIKKEFGERCIPLYIPDASGPSISRVFSSLHDKDTSEEAGRVYDQIVESIVETDDDLMEKYLEGEEISEEELIKAFMDALLHGSLFPVVATAAEKEIGTKDLLHVLTELVPPHDAISRIAYKGDEEIDVHQEKGFVGYVYKSVDDEYVSRISYIRVLSGKLPNNSTFINRRTGNTERVGHIFKVFGKEQKDIPHAVAGDLIAVPRINDMEPGDIITDNATDIRLEETTFPIPMVSFAINPKSRKDEQKIGPALKELEHNDKTFTVHTDRQTGDYIISGMSDLHLNLMLKKLKRKNKIDVDVSPPHIPYKETIRNSVERVEYTHKKQSGGAGQYGKVYINLEPKPRGEGYEFVDKIFAGVIDQTFRQSVDKGIRAKMEEGVFAGYPVADVQVTLVDGKTHPVDSKDIAFQIAGREAFKKAFLECDPVLLEPMVKMEITIPNDKMGEIIGDLNSKRAKIVSTESQDDTTTVGAIAPLAELQSYQAQLKSMTSGEGSFIFEFDHYDYVPPNIQKRILDQKKT